MFLERSINNLKELLLQDSMFITDKSKKVVCSQINGLAGYGLVKLGYLDLAKSISKKLFYSSLYDSSLGMFHREIDVRNKITRPEYNIGKNACMGLLLVASGMIQEAMQLRSALYESCAYDKEQGLFLREFYMGKINNLLVTQTNLLMAVLEIELGKTAEAERIYKALEKNCFRKEYHLFASNDAENPAMTDFFYSDDQALAIIVAHKLGKQHNSLLLAMKEHFLDRSTGLFRHSKSQSTITSYKNGWCGVALSLVRDEDAFDMLRSGMEGCLLDSESRLFYFSDTNRTIVADSSILGLLAITGIKI